MAQRPKTDRDARMLTRSRHSKLPDVALEHNLLKTPRKKPNKAPKHKSNANMAQTSNNKTDQPTLGKSKDGIDESDAATGGVAKDSADENEDDESEAFAPSGHAIERIGHQTGLSSAKDEEESSNAICWNGRISPGGTYEFDPEMVEIDWSTKQIARPPSVLRSVPSIREAFNDDERFSYDDDDGYEAVDAISNSDEDEPRVERLEEDLIIESMEKDMTEIHHPFAPASPSSPEEWYGTDIDGGLVFGDLPQSWSLEDRADRVPFHDEINELVPELPSWLDFASSPITQRRVHFADDVDGPGSYADSIVGDDDSELLLIHQRPRKNAFVLTDAESGSGNVGHLGDDGFSHYDVNQNYRTESQLPGPVAIPTPEESPVQSGSGSDESGGNSSGYETDEGETTDDEVIPPTTINRPQALLRLHSNSSVSKKAVATPVQFSARGKSKARINRRGPPLGSFRPDPKKPIAIIDHTGKFMIIYPATRPPKTSRLFGNSPPGSASSGAPSSPSAPFMWFAEDNEDLEREMNAEKEAESTMIGTDTNLMIPGVEHVSCGDAQGPPEAFHSCHSRPSGAVVTDEDFEMDGNDGETGLFPYEDYINFGTDTSADEAETSSAAKPFSPSSTEVKATVLPAAKATNNPSNDLLAHLSQKELVAAFRRDQNNRIASMHRTNINPASHALKGPRLGEFSISPKSPIKSPIQHRKEKINASYHHSHSHPYLGIPAKKRVANTQRKNRST